MKPPACIRWRITKQERGGRRRWLGVLIPERPLGALRPALRDCALADGSEEGRCARDVSRFQTSNTGLSGPPPIIWATRPRGFTWATRPPQGLWSGEGPPISDDFLIA